MEDLLDWQRRKLLRILYHVDFDIKLTKREA